MIIRPSPAEHYPWIAKRAQLVIGETFRAIEAVDESGRIHGMVGYDGWQGNSVCCHIAIENPAALRHLLGPGFGIPFVECKRGALLCTVLSTNQRSRRLVRRLGFREILVGRDWWANGVDMHVFEMRREECRYLAPKMRRAA